MNELVCFYNFNQLTANHEEINYSKLMRESVGDSFQDERVKKALKKSSIHKRRKYGSSYKSEASLLNCSITIIAQSYSYLQRLKKLE